MNNYQYGDGLRKELLFAIPFINKKIKVLEIGCGYGSFKFNFQLNNEYWGVDSNPHVAEKANERLDCFIFGTFDEVKSQLPDNYFDCIVCNDVIEHMSDEDIFFQNVKSKLTSDGVIIGSIPNVRYITNIIKFIFLRDWSYVVTGILDKTHLRFFTMKSLIKTLKKNEFDIIFLKGINPYSFNKNNNLFTELFKYIILNILVIVFGFDSKYLQFAFKIKQKN
jgi:2-polyprenyl-3-methyl-5-hydroxy-6-metoxy-1,4-benzoquinol methylase